MSEENNKEEFPRIASQEEQELASVEKYARTNPELLPAQFKGDAEKFIASYKELRKTLTKTQQELSTFKKKEESVNVEQLEPQQTKEVSLPTDKLSIPDTPQTKEQPSEADWEGWGNELRTNGNISNESREKIKKRFNIPDVVIDEYVEGMRQKSIAAVQEAANLVGGNDKLKEIIDWSTQNLNDSERTMINSQLASSNWKTTILGLQVRMDRARPNPTSKEPKRINSSEAKIGNMSTSSIEPFANRSEMTMCMRDPRYGKDSKYTEWVQNRVRATSQGRWSS